MTGVTLDDTTRTRPQPNPDNYNPTRQGLRLLLDRPGSCGVTAAAPRRAPGPSASAVPAPQEGVGPQHQAGRRPSPRRRRHRSVWRVPAIDLLARWCRRTIATQLGRSGRRTPAARRLVAPPRTRLPPDGAGCAPLPGPPAGCRKSRPGRADPPGPTPSRPGPPRAGDPGTARRRLRGRADRDSALASSTSVGRSTGDGQCRGTRAGTDRRRGRRMTAVYPPSPLSTCFASGLNAGTTGRFGRQSTSSVWGDASDHRATAKRGLGVGATRSRHRARR